MSHKKVVDDFSRSNALKRIVIQEQGLSYCMLSGVEEYLFQKVFPGVVGGSIKKSSSGFS